MRTIAFKLKQASAVLGVSSKDLQNLVQLKVIRPTRRENIFWFDRRQLLEAKVAFYLKASLGSSSELLSLFTAALSDSLDTRDAKTPRSISLRSRPPGGTQFVEIRIPIGSLARELEAQLPRATEQPDLTRGRRRAGWRAEIARAMEDAAKQMGAVSDAEARAAILAVRRSRKPVPEVTVVDNTSIKTA